MKSSVSSQSSNSLKRRLMAAEGSAISSPCCQMKRDLVERFPRKQDRGWKFPGGYQEDAQKGKSLWARRVEKLLTCFRSVFWV